ncbi:YrbL family protein [Thalassotalea euphylliae]|uniref:PhoP regulatory network protein YrbL n=1 Tax=Thalassotalea euphylliae TaxID=1655234 RepID=A0A3E0UBZ0_9GAMM|nr:YrbL family protein [Thalassotalea euphylliae]REL34103.1 hypothetical protein DXX92_01395 [Thalassotalea euphylliae]
MLILDNTLYFAQGTTRKCYLHPRNPDLCVKIPLQNQLKRQRGILRSIERENTYYKKLVKNNISWSHLCQYHGDVQTNLGTGSIYQVIRDTGGEIARNLEHYLQQENFVHDYQNQLVIALRALFAYMVNNRIVTTSLLPRNIVLTGAPDNFKLTIIDDIGNSEWLKVSELTTALTIRKIRRKWHKMLTDMQAKYEGLSESLIDDVLNA